MDTIFIDTSIFEANNFMEGKRINEIFKLSERGVIQVVITQLTYDEILNRISKGIDDASLKFKKYRDDTRILRNAPSLAEKFEFFNNKNVKEEISISLKQRFAQSKFIIIEYPTLNIEEIFINYFNNEFPFNTTNKKYEFPDAFALKSLENWALEKGVKVFVFSKDNDMLNYQSKNLEIVEDFEVYLNDKILEVEGEKLEKRISQVEDLIYNHSEVIVEAIREWTETQLDDYNKYYKYSNFYEVHNIAIQSVNIDIEDFNITNFTEENIGVELKVALNYNVEIIIDDEDYMYKDFDNKEWVFLETKPMFINEVRYIEVDLIFEIVPNVEEISNPVIEKINGGRDLNV